MATPKNKKAYRYGKAKKICFTAEKESICFTGRERVPTGAGAPEHGGTACRTASGKFKRCAGGPRRGPRQAGLFGRRAAAERDVALDFTDTMGRISRRPPKQSFDYAYVAGPIGAKQAQGLLPRGAALPTADPGVGAAPTASGAWIIPNAGPGYFVVAQNLGDIQRIGGTYRGDSDWSRWRGSRAQARRPTKAALDAAVKAMRLFHGGQGGYVRARDYDKLYARAVKAVSKIADTTGLSYQGAWSQIEDKAHAEGRLRPQPGKDY